MVPFLLALALGATACGGGEPVDAGDAGNAADAAIDLPEPAGEETAVTLRLTATTYEGELFCNRYGGDVDIGTGRIAFSKAGATEEGCELEASQTYLDALPVITEFGFDDPSNPTRLVLTGDGRKLIFENLG